MTQLLVVDVGVEVHGLGAKDEVYLCGSDAALGAWNVEQALRLTPASKRFAGGCTSWRSKVALPVGQEIKYKYVVHSGDQWRWEPGFDRSLPTEGNVRPLVELRDFHRTSEHCHACAARQSGEGENGRDRASARPHDKEDRMVPRMSASSKVTDLSLASDVSEPVIEGDDTEDAAQLLQETDTFLESQAVTTSNGTPFKDVVRKNRLLIARCRSVLDKAVDEATILQVESRMQALNSAYDAAATISHHLTQESLMAKNAGGRVHNPNFPGMYMSKTTTQTTTAHYRPGSVEPVAFEASTTTRFRASSIEPVS